MSVTFRPARRADVPAIVALLADDVLGARRESEEMAVYFKVFDRMHGDESNRVIVGEEGGTVVATYQLTFIDGLSLRATRRAMLESIRVASDRRGQGIGHLLMADAEARARAASCGLIQLATNRGRDRAQAFYEDVGFTASHIGYKRKLD